MRRLTPVLCVCALFVCLGPQVADAGPLATDPTAMPGYTGTIVFNAAGQLLVDLDHAVFMPGTYPDDGVNGNDPSNGAEYVYAYQAYVLGGTSLTSTTVGLLLGSGAGNAMADPLHVQTGGVEPLLSSVGSSSVLTVFNPIVNGGEYSTVYLFTSPNPPTYVSGSVVGGGLGDQQLVPSPIPEPGSLALLGLVALGLFRHRRV